MSAYVSPQRALKNALVSLVQTITYDTGSGPEQAFQLVTTDPKAEFDQEPYCFVHRVKTQSKLVQTASNDRTVTFTLVVVLSLENGQRTQQQTYDYMDDLTELVQNTLDTADFTDALSSYQNIVNTYIVAAETNTPVPGQSKGGLVLLNTIDVAIKYVYDL